MIQNRVFAVDTIMALRAGSEHGSSGLRSFKVPVTASLDACDLKSLIDWKAETITEPVFTARMSPAQLDALKVAPLELPPYSALKVAREQSNWSLRQLNRCVVGPRGMALFEHRCVTGN